MVDRRSLAVALGGTLAMWAGVGCTQYQSERLNAPPQGDSERRAALRDHFDSMSDNAAQKDSTIADIHFEPHIAELSGLGVTRLTQLGEVHSATRGVIYYETALADQMLISDRLQSVRDFLAASGFDTDRITVQAGISQNRSGTAKQAMIAREKGSGAAAAAGAPPAGAPMMAP
jgi:hypothetical protein